MGQYIQILEVSTVSTLHPKLSVADPKLIEQFEIFLKLRPFISICLKLNHDLNNPLAGIIGYTEFLVMEPDGMTEDQVDLINKIAECASRMERIIKVLCDEKNALSEGLDLNRVNSLFEDCDRSSQTS